MQNFFEKYPDQKIIKEEMQVMGNKTPETPRLYLVLWTRIANFGRFFVWASSPEHALEKVSWDANYVQHTVVEVVENQQVTVWGTEK